MKPLVWDFGQLDDSTEELYAKEIVNNPVSRRLMSTVMFYESDFSCVNA